MATFIQPSFAKGEIGPALYGRVDTAAYQVAIRTALNMVVHTHGGISNRPGLKFICPVKTHSAEPVLIDFQFKATDTYVIEMGNLYMRFIRNDAQVLEATQTLTAIGDQSPNAQLTIAGHGYSDGDHVYISGVGGATELNGRWFIVSSKATNTFELTDPYDGSTVIAFADLTTYTTGGDVGKVYEVVTPYATADLPQLKWTQSADVMTVTHPTYAVREITRTDHNAWTLTQPTFTPSITAPTSVAVSVSGADNDINWKYKITAIKEETFEESLAGRGTGLTVASTNNLNPVSVAITGHDLITGDEVEFTGLTEMTEINDRRFIITKVDANSFTLNGEDGTSYTDEATGGANTCYGTFDTAGTQAAPTGTTIPDNTITWAAVTGAIKYTIYRAEGGKADYGFLAETAELTYTDSETAKQSTDISITPPTARNPFRIAAEYPAAVGYYQQRRVFGGSTGKPDTQYFSQTGNQSNFTTSRPLQADDAITATMSSRQVNQIRHFIPQSDMLVLTDGAEWRVNSGDNSGFSSDTIKFEPQTAWGANHLPPHVAGQIVLYVQENNIAVRSLGFQLSIDGYTGTDLTLLAPQIFGNTTAVSWGFTRSPDPVVHIVKADGDVAIMTFNEEQEVLAWARWHTRNGLFKWCTAMRPSSTEVNDAAYFVVERVINSNTVLLIERVASRRFDDVQDTFFVDCGLSLNSPVALAITTTAHKTAVLADPVVLQATAHGFSDGDLIDIEGIVWTPVYDSDENETQPDQLNGRRYRVVDKATNTVTLGGTESPKVVTGITKANPGVVTAPAHGFSNGDIINMHGIAGMTEANNNIYKVASAATDTFALNTAADASVDTTGFTTYTNGGNVYNAVDGSAFAGYSRGGNLRKAVTSVAGLNHLEGESVIILADGNVIDGKTVASGAITLTTAASRVHVGIQMVADLETLDVEAPEGTIQGKKKKLSQVTVRFEKSRGLLIGPNKDLLVEMKQRENETLGTPTALLTGDKSITLKPSWNSNGRLLLRQVNPLPFTILAIVPDIVIGD